MKNSRARRRSPRSALLVGAMTVVIPCHGCCTAMVWGHVPDDELAAIDAKNAARCDEAQQKGTPPAAAEGYGFFADTWTVWSIGLRVAITPLALWVDLVSWPEEMLNGGGLAPRKA